MYECMTKGFLPTQCSEVSSQVRVVRCSHLVVPEDTDTHINMIEASTPRGFHLLHAAGQGNLDPELVCKSRELYVLTFTFTRLRSKITRSQTSSQQQDRAISWTSTSIPFSAFMGTLPHLGVRDISKGLVNHKNQ